MIFPEDIRDRALSLWDSRKVFKAYLENKNIFPWTVPFRRPPAGEWGERFPEIREWMRRLKAGSKEVLGRGYALSYRDVNHRSLGNQRVPDKIIVETLEDFLSLAGKEREFKRFVKASERILGERPGFRPFLSRRPGLVLEHEDEWDRLLAVCGFLSKHPLPGLYLRQLDVPGVDTKFIEQRRELLADLLEELLPDGAKVPGVRGPAWWFVRCYRLTGSPVGQAIRRQSGPAKAPQISTSAISAHRLNWIARSPARPRPPKPAGARPVGRDPRAARSRHWSEVL